MDLLKKELERKKKAVGLAKQQQQQQQDSSSNKFLKATELRKLQEEQEERLHEEAKRRSNDDDDDKSEDSCNKRLRPRTNGDTDESTATRSSNKKRRYPPLHAKPSTTTEKAATTITTSSDGDGSLKDLSVEQVTERLRAYGLAVRLFGEDEDTRRDRLRVATSQHENAKYNNERDEFQLGGGHGIRNPFLERKTKQRHDDQVLPESLAKTAPAAGDIPSQAKEIKPKDTEDDEADPHKQIYRFFKDLLKQWEEDLALRPEDVKRTMAGKNETKILKQCKDYIRPLFKLCKTRKLEEGMTIHLTNIVQSCQEGEFVKANDAYMDVAIGRAAWPIGVTMVGIHARSGRERIGSSNVAHVMNSELQRKYLTSVKRLITYCQKKRSDVAPSKKVMN